jgi:hypothetical protein
MTKDDILSMAMKSGIVYSQSLNEFNTPFSDGVYFDDLADFAALVAERVREDCAKLAQSTVCDTHIPTGVKIYGTAAAKAIRARGEAK